MNKLFKILNIVERVRSSDWSDVRKIVALMPDIIIKEKLRADKFKQEWCPLDLSKIDTWSTYDGECIDLMFSTIEGKLICDVRIYDGESLYGYRKNLRFTAVLELPNTFIEEIERKILYALDRLAEDSYKDYLETQKKLWLNDFKSKILK